MFWFILGYKITYWVHWVLNNLPKNVPAQNGTKGTSTNGAHTLINQLGRNGVIRKNII